MTNAPLSKPRIRAAFARSAPRYAQNDTAQRTIAQALLASLPVPLPALPIGKPLLDAGCGLGRDLPLLGTRFPGQPLVGVDAALPLLTAARKQAAAAARWVVGDLETLPFAAQSVAVYWSNCAWQWTDPARTVAEAHRVLAPGGLLAASIVAAGTFPELVTAAHQLGEPPSVAPLPDQTVWQKVLTVHLWQSLTFSPYTLTCYFPDPRQLLDSIRGVGATATPTRRPFDRKRHERLCAALAAQATPRGVPLTYRVLLAVAFR